MALPLHQMLDQYRQIIEPLAQRRHLQREYVQPVVQILAEAARDNGRIQVAMGRGDDAHVAADGFIAADPLEAALLQHAQQFHLHLQRHVADLVQEQRAALGKLEAAEPRRQGAGEGAFFVAEQLAFQEVGRYGAAVHRYKRMRCAAGQFVNVARHHFLAGAGLPEDQDIGVERRDLFNQTMDGAHRLRCAARTEAMGARLGGVAAAHVLRLIQDSRQAPLLDGRL